MIFQVWVANGFPPKGSFNISVPESGKKNDENQACFSSQQPGKKPAAYPSKNPTHPWRIVVILTNFSFK
jgi:hypothetical protein